MTHETLTEAVTVALRERLARLRSELHPDLISRVDRLVAEYTAHPVRDPRSAEEIVGYDASGLPR